MYNFDSLEFKVPKFLIAEIRLKLYLEHIGQMGTLPSHFFDKKFVKTMSQLKM